MYIAENTMSKAFNKKYKDLNNTKPYKKFSDKNLAVQTIKQQQLMKDQIAKMKLQQDKQIANLQKRKNELIKTIKDICDSNKGVLNQFKGLSSDLDHILDGDTDYVLEQLDYYEVASALSGAQKSVIAGDINLLSDYFKSGLNETMSFKDYVMQFGSDEAKFRLENSLNSDNSINFNSIADEETKGICKLLDLIKNEYKRLFDLNNLIKETKEANKKRIDKMMEALERVTGISVNTTDFISSLNDKNKKKIDTIV